jgi:hypothetical protein
MGEVGQFIAGRGQTHSPWPNRHPVTGCDDAAADLTGLPRRDLKSDQIKSVRPTRKPNL